MVITTSDCSAPLANVLTVFTLIAGILNLIPLCFENGLSTPWCALV